MNAFELIVPGACVFFADQLTKSLAVRLLAKGRSVRLTSGVQIRLTTDTTRNRRSLVGRCALLLLWASTLVGLILLIQHGDVFRHAVARLGLGAALGGAASNLYDWLRRGTVIDLVKVGWWPVFNLADVGITLGAILALWFIW
jgi:signal peptidase II